MSPHRITVLLLLASIIGYALGYATESGAIGLVAFLLECKCWVNLARQRSEPGDRDPR